MMVLKSKPTVFALVEHRLIEASNLEVVQSSFKGRRQIIIQI